MPDTRAAFTVDPNRGPSDPLFRFGVIADPQYAAIPPNRELNRYYAKSLGKLNEAIETFNAAELQFVVTLGDIIDRDFASYDDILPLYSRLRHPQFFLLGNHDFAVAAQHLPAIAARVGLERTYYDFAGGGYRFILLDGNEVSLFAPPEGDSRRAIAADHLEALTAAGAANAQRWNGALSDAQFAWLDQTISAAEQAGERIIVMNHYPVYPANAHNLWDSERVADRLTRSRHVVAYFNGHNHAGNYGALGDIHFVNFKGMVDTPDSNTYAIVEIFEDRIAIHGFGREESRVLPLARG
ncbi:metallophosphoesterase [Kaistia dalseonensis]|uniref:3',5'-cyclic AMP phosphodiesterase CpdA n=1 Tax=Kaistia dalseonensis TaxID=410840 RepID=A0ABU0HB15_9HYPH|nr:metallophosphoesterase [Kaistia dalseonensis]MCX5496829.1 metallophosphoesterase [Kaistia dalseonensis]MDQ0439455.1 3',5'-cyclic AMP phosphodiesterase CpdA [Kaistia dalseonensis]